MKSASVSLVAASTLVAMSSGWLIGSGTRVVYQDNCGFPGGDSYGVQAPATDCGDICANDPGCTHWSWELFNGGTCWMENTDRSQVVYVGGVNCGYVRDRFAVTAPDDSASVWLLGSDGRVFHHSNCDLQGDDTYSVQAPATDCGNLCADNGACTHWSWSDFNGGTCWMKGGTVATRTDVDGAHCGYVINRFAPATSENGMSTEKTRTFLNGFNSYRINAKLPPFSIDDRMASAAFLHSSDMASTGKLSNIGSDGSGGGHRLEDQGYVANSREWYEIVASGPVDLSNPSTIRTPNDIVEILIRAYINVGFARARVGSNEYWTVLLSHPV